MTAGYYASDGVTIATGLSRPDANAKVEAINAGGIRASAVLNGVRLPTFAVYVGPEDADVAADLCKGVTA